MKSNLYTDNIQNIVDYIKRNIDYRDVESRVQDFITFAKNKGIDLSLIDKVYNSETRETIFPDDSKRRMRFPVSIQAEFQEAFLKLIVKECQGIIDSSDEIDWLSKGEAVLANNLGLRLDEWTPQLSRMSSYHSRFWDFKGYWESLWNKTIQQERVRSNCEFYLNTLQEKVQLSKKARSQIKQLNIDYRYRLSGETRWNKTITVNFIINNPRMTIYGDVDRVHDTYTVPYGMVDPVTGECSPITVQVVYKVGEIVRALCSYPVTNESEDEGYLSEVGNLFRYTTPFRIFGKARASSPKNRRIVHPFIEGWGATSRAPCFGSMDGMIYQAISRMDWLATASYLREWVSKFVVNSTQPYQQPYLMYQGIPKEYGIQALYVGTDNRVCHTNWVRTSDDCKAIDCQLIDNSGCSEYTYLVDKEIAEKLRITQEDERKRLRTALITGKNVPEEDVIRVFGDNSDEYLEWYGHKLNEDVDPSAVELSQELLQEEHF
ncbi:MAG: hypothetical protein CMI54_07285 [Parcubacteria group bacterium]|nr:hypothetical protein [Parcubacteria group bacterium]|tara:strand:+ start:1705 stop:3174 length:1470 start_codon:yes stop_codon:yes gene_type:complete